MEKRFKVIGHTSDIGGTVYGETLDELFLNASQLFCFLSEIVYNDTVCKLTTSVTLKSYSLESLMVKFLNELVYRIETEKIFSRVKNLKIDQKGDEIILYAEITSSAIIEKRREIKSATYHNLEIKKRADGFITTIIFDV